MKDRNRIPATKKELLVRLLDLGKVMIHLDARCEDVDVPTQFKEDADLRLNLSYRFQYGGLTVDESGVTATLSFSGFPHTCRVPIGSVYAITSHVSGESYFFPTDAPPEALAGFAAMMAPLSGGEDGSDEGEAKSPGEGDHEPVEKGRPLLRAIDGGLAGAEKNDDLGPKMKREDGAEADRDSQLGLFEEELTSIEPEGDDADPTDGWTARPESVDETAPSPSTQEGVEQAGSDEDIEEPCEPASAGRRFGHLRVIK